MEPPDHAHRQRQDDCVHDDLHHTCNHPEYVEVKALSCLRRADGDESRGAAAADGGDSASQPEGQYDYAEQQRQSTKIAVNVKEAAVHEQDGDFDGGDIGEVQKRAHEGELEVGHMLGCGECGCLVGTDGDGCISSLCFYADT